MSAPRFALVPAAPIEARDLLDRMNAPAPMPLRLTKRAEFFLEEMIAAGERGITTIDYPGVRVGDAVHKLRKAGVQIETKYEAHHGEFAGSHGRYVLRSTVRRLAPVHTVSPVEERPHV
jgi:hypothetical protein